MQRRLLPLTREPQARLSTELEKVRVVYVRGLLRMPFREMRGYLRDLSPTLSPRSLLSISYFGPITSFICIDESIASVLSDALTCIGGRVDHHFRPWLPLCRDQHDDDAAKLRAEEAFCHCVAGEIVSSPNLLLATFLQRQLAPHLAPTISAIVRGAQHHPTQTSPPPPPTVPAREGPRSSPPPVPSTAPHTSPNTAPPSAAPPVHIPPHTVTAALALSPIAPNDAALDSPIRAAKAASTSAPAESGALAEGTA